MKRKLLSILLSSLLIFVSIGSAIVFPQEVNATAPVTVVNGEIAPQDAPWTGVNWSECNNYIYNNVYVTSGTDATLKGMAGADGHALADAQTDVHGAGEKLWVTLGDSSTNLAGIVGNSGYLATLVTNIKSLISTYSLDGIDIDWENADETPALTTSLINALYSGISVPISITLDWTAVNTGLLTLATSAKVKYINLMTYDMTTSSYTIGYPYAANYDDSVLIMAAASTYGYTASKLLMGVPFYGYDDGSSPNDNGGNIASYSQIFSQLSPSPSTNTAGYAGDNWTINGFLANNITVGGGILTWNSINDVKEKVDFCSQQGYAGVFCFVLEDDYLNSNSGLLYNAYQENQVVQGLTRALYAHYTGLDGSTDNSYYSIYSPRLLAQTFTPSVANTIQDFKIHAWRTGSPGSVTGAIYAVDGANKPTGSALCTSSSVNANNFPTSDAGCCFQTFTFASGANLLAGVQYAFVLSVPSGSSGQEVDVMADTATHSYAGGAAVYNSSGNSGDANWAIQTADAQFEEFGALYITTATLTLSAPTNITATSATLNGNITVAGGNNPTVTIYWQANSDGGNIAGNWANTSAPTSPLQPQGVSAFYLTLTGLTAGTTYYFNAYAVNAAGGVWAGTSQSFTTSSASTASVSISAATAILSTSAILNGNVTAVGGANPTVTIYYGTADGGNVAGNWQKRSVPTSPTQPQGVAAFYLNISGLSSSTKYYFNASVTNSGGTVWAGASLNFTTSSLFADTYKNYFPIIITDTSGVARTNVPILTGLSGQGLINSNYVNSGATDTAMKLYNTGTVSDTDEPYNIDTAEIPIVIPSLPANGSVEFDLYTGYSPVKTSFPIIVGNGGKLTTSYNVALELGSAWEIDVNNGTPSYINTSTSEIGAYILNKAGEATIKVTALNQLTATVYDGSGAETIVLSISSGVYSISLALASGTLTFTVGSSSNTTSVGTVVNNTNNWIWDSDGVVMPYISNIELKVPSGSYPTLRTYVNPASSPTMIYNQTELQNINNNLAGNYELANDITCSGEFVPIGAYPVSPFTGILDGNGYKIKNLSQTAGYGGGGLFGYIGASGIVQNIQMTNCTIGANLFWDNQGAICGDNAGTIQNCYSTGAVEGETFIGGLVGTNEGTIQNCYSWCSVTASQSGTNGICGGLCGQNSGTITGCYETGTLSGKYQDGFCKVNSGTISSSYCDWTESGTSACSGVANTTDANMKIQSTYSGWNFTVVWFPLVIIELQYQPNTIISGTTLPDLSGNSYNGTITWGTNSDITIGTSSPISSQPVVYNPSNGASGAQSGSQLPSGGQGYQLPQVTMPANWYGTTNTNLPLYGVFTAASQSSGIPVNTLYFIIMVLVAFGAFFFSVVNTHSIMLSGAVFVGLLAMESGTGVVPGWIPYVMGIGVIGILFLARQIG